MCSGWMVGPRLVRRQAMRLGRGGEDIEGAGISLAGFREQVGAGEVEDVAFEPGAADLGVGGEVLPC